jgi:hypothetical protein
MIEGQLAIIGLREVSFLRQPDRNITFSEDLLGRPSVKDLPCINVTPNGRWIANISTTGEFELITLDLTEKKSIVLPWEVEEVCLPVLGDNFAVLVKYRSMEWVCVRWDSAQILGFGQIVLG